MCSLEISRAMTPPNFHDLFLMVIYPAEKRNGIPASIEILLNVVLKKPRTYVFDRFFLRRAREVEGVLFLIRLPA